MPNRIHRFVPPDAARRLSALIWLGALLLVLAIGVSSVVSPELGEEPGVMRYAAYAAFLGRTFVFHMGVAVVVLGACAAVLGRPLQAIAVGGLGVALAVGLAGLGRGQSPTLLPGTPVLRVMSINLLAGNEDAAGVLAAIEEEKPDVVLFQEYTERWHAMLRPRLAPAFPEYTQAARPDAFGQAIYAKRPFLGPAVRSPLSNIHSTPQLTVRIEHGGRPLIIRNIHLLSPSSPDLMYEGFVEAQRLAAESEARTGPMLLMGDFNATPNSAHASLIRSAGFIDCHTAAGVGRGSTWPMRSVLRFAPGVRIDHAYVSQELTPIAMRTGAATGSDHRPLIVDVIWSRR